MSLAVLRIAGRRLADDLSGQADPRSLVLAIPRRGAVVARQVALRLRLHVDVLPVTPLVVAGPSGVEATAGALAMWGTPVLDDDLRRHLEVDDDGVATALALARVRLGARWARWDGAAGHAGAAGAAPPSLAGVPVIVVDDAAISGLTMAAAVDGARARGATRLVAAVAMATPEAVERIRGRVDAVVTLELVARHLAASRHAAVAHHIHPPIDDDDVGSMLRDAERAAAEPRAS